MWYGIKYCSSPWVLTIKSIKTDVQTEMWRHTFDKCKLYSSAIGSKRKEVFTLKGTVKEAFVKEEALHSNTKKKWTGICWGSYRGDGGGGESAFMVSAMCVQYWPPVLTTLTVVNPCKGLYSVLWSLLHSFSVTSFIYMASTFKIQMFPLVETSHYWVHHFLPRKSDYP